MHIWCCFCIHEKLKSHLRLMFWRLILENCFSNKIWKHIPIISVDACIAAISLWDTVPKEGNEAFEKCRKPRSLVASGVNMAFAAACLPHATTSDLLAGWSPIWSKEGHDCSQFVKPEWLDSWLGLVYGPCNFLELGICKTDQLETVVCYLCISICHALFIRLRRRRPGTYWQLWALLHQAQSLAASFISLPRCVRIIPDDENRQN